jgi:hypothetical protein
MLKTTKFLHVGNWFQKISFAKFLPELKGQGSEGPSADPFAFFSSFNAVALLLQAALSEKRAGEKKGR